MGVWFASTFGIDAAKAMEAERDLHRGEKNKTVQDLEDYLASLDQLYQNRYTTDLDLPSLVRGGFYGQIIKKAWLDEEKI